MFYAEASPGRNSNRRIKKATLYLQAKMYCMKYYLMALVCLLFIVSGCKK